MSDIYQPDKEEKIDLDERIPMQPPTATVVSTIGKSGCNCTRSFASGEVEMENYYLSLMIDYCVCYNIHMYKSIFV